MNSMPGCSTLVLRPGTGGVIFPKGLASDFLDLPVADRRRRGELVDEVPDRPDNNPLRGRRPGTGDFSGLPAGVAIPPGPYSGTILARTHRPQPTHVASIQPRRRPR